MTRPCLDQKKTGGEETGEAPAFRCCVKEYGVRRRVVVREGGEGEGEGEEGEVEREGGVGWERRWRMFGTTIS